MEKERRKGTWRQVALLLLVAAFLVSGTGIFKKKIEENHPWADRAISELGLKDELVVIIYRNRRVIIPKGATVIRTDDILVMSEPAE